jgi:hypothetical protein
MPPFDDEPVAVDESRRLWLGRDMLDRDVLDRWVGVLLFVLVLTNTAS